MKARFLDSLPAVQRRRKKRFRARCAADLARFLAGGERISLPASENPRVSVLVVLFNAAELSLQLFRSLARTIDVPAEVIVVDNASSDATEALCARLDGARIVRNAANEHFLRGSNQAAALARGKFLLFVNSDVILHEGAVRFAAETLDADPHAGAVGGRIILPSGRLQEAGSLVWRDGFCLGIGRDGDPEDPQFRFRREVDYCSGAFLAVRERLFRDLGGFDELFAPAYFEESDLCMRLRARGFATVYDPRIAVTHFEFGSSAAPAAIALQERNHALFVRQHRPVLEAEHHPPESGELAARMRGGRRGRILVVDDQLPLPSLGAGFPRAAELVRALHAAGWFVSFYPLSEPDISDWEATFRLWPRDIEILAGRGRSGLVRTLRERAGYYDAALVSRPHNMAAFGRALKWARRFGERTKVIYDAEAIFAKREALEATVLGRPETPEKQHAKFMAEMNLARDAAAVVTVSQADAELFSRATGKPTVVIGHTIEPEPSQNDFAARRDILFVGALAEDGTPNVDSLRWFAAEVMPRLDRLIGTDYVLHAVGRNGSEEAQALAGARVRLWGQVDDLAPFFEQARLFIAPTRFAAGIPMKVHTAAARGLPVVVTSLLAEQLGWRHRAEALVADGPDAFAETCGELYRDAALWQNLRENALLRVARDCSPQRFAAHVGRMLALVAPEPKSRTADLVGMAGNE